MRREADRALRGRHGARPVPTVAEHVDEDLVGAGVLGGQGQRAPHHPLGLVVAVLPVQRPTQSQQCGHRPGVAGQHVAEALLRLSVAAQVEEHLGVRDRLPVVGHFAGLSWLPARSPLSR